MAEPVHREPAPEAGAAPTDDPATTAAACRPVSLAPGATGTGRVAVPYESPLVAFRGYRAAGEHVLQSDRSPRPRRPRSKGAYDRDHRAGARPAGKAEGEVCTGIFAYHIDPARALCPFDLRGLCHDPRCPWLSRDDYTLNAAQRTAAHAALAIDGAKRGGVKPHPVHPDCLSLRTMPAWLPPPPDVSRATRLRFLASREGAPRDVEVPVYISPSVPGLGGVGCSGRAGGGGRGGGGGGGGGRGSGGGRGGGSGGGGGVSGGGEVGMAPDRYRYFHNTE
jgi:hypothetical protein